MSRLTRFSRLSRGLTTSAFALLTTGALAGPEAMTAQEARHLLSRTGFGAAPHEIDALVSKSYRDGVDLILAAMSPEPSIPMPQWVDAPLYPNEHIWTLGQTADELFFSNRAMELEDLGSWWMAEMVATPSPLTEKLTLFWHDHFATSYEDVEAPQWLAQQNRFLRQNAAGNFADLAAGILKDPAMLVYLTNVENLADDPNENLGREFLELFTLGEGVGYSQQDVVAAAQMLTGHSVATVTAPVYTFNAEDHDSGPKTLFGQTGAYGADDLVAMTLAHPDFGPYIVEKLWRLFVSDTPDPSEVARLTQIWLDHDLEMTPLLDALFMSDAFWDDSNRGRLVKSPVDLVVGTVRTLGLPVEDAVELAWISDEMGQTLFYPPNVGGWPDGVAWINDATAIARATALNQAGFAEGISGAGPASPEDMAGMMMADNSGATPAVSAPKDALRVGQVFVTDARTWTGGIGAMAILYDVSFQGQTWRSVPVWMERDRVEDYAGFGVLTADCAPECFDAVPQDDGWIWYAPWEGALDDGLAEASDFDVDLLQAIAGHMPALIETTKGQVVWDPDPYAEAGFDQIATPAQVIALAQDLARDSTAAIGATQSDLVLGLRVPGMLGLEGRAQVTTLEDIDTYLEATAEARRRPAIPQVVYGSGRDWLNALPGTGPESERAAQALLAVARRTQGQRDALIAQDPDALIRALILMPEYQVN